MSKGFIRPEEAHANAQRMREIASNLNEILNSIDARMREIDDVEAGVDAGSRSSSFARTEFENLIQEFPKFYEQVNLFADDVDEAANTMVAQ